MPTNNITQLVPLTEDQIFLIMTTSLEKMLRIRQQKLNDEISPASAEKEISKLSQVISTLSKHKNR